MTKQDELKELLQPLPDIELAVLTGSQASGNVLPQSDWGIAVRWEKIIRGTLWSQLMEILRQQISNAIEIRKDQIDCIDKIFVRLAMRAVRYLGQAWAELEGVYWGKSNAA